MKSPFSNLAMHYIKNGYSPLPVALGKKLPSFKYNGAIVNMGGWSKYCDSILEDWRMKTLAKDDLYGICLATGFNGLVAIDVDDKRAYRAIQSVFGNMRPPSKKGERGATAFFIDPTRAIKTEFMHHKPENDSQIVGPVLVEVLAHGRQTVIPPTIHPKTEMPYTWHNASLQEIHVRDLPILTRQHLQDLKEELGDILHIKQEYSKEIKTQPVNLDPQLERRYSAYAQAAFRNSVCSLSNQPNPGRNRALFNTACKLGWAVHRGFVGKDAFIHDLVKACESNGLIRDNGKPDTIRTIYRGLKQSINDALPELKAIA